jgi:hypothetical protein
MKRGWLSALRGGCFLENKLSSTLMRGAAAPVSSGMRLSQRAGMVAGATTWQPLQGLRVSRVTFRKMAGFAIAPQARMQRTLALIQLSVISESCVSKF